MNKTTLYFFTNSFPYGLGETWKLNELNILVNEFDEIHVIPMAYKGNKDNPKKLPEGIILHEPLITQDKITVNKYSVFKIIDSHLFFYLKDFFRKRLFTNKTNFFKWMARIVRMKLMLKNAFIKELISSNNPNAFYYFFFGVGPADMIPLLNKNKKKKIIVRMHRFDLFEDEVGDYIPFRKDLMEHSTLIAPSSLAGKVHLDKLYPNYSNKVSTIMLGVVGKGKSTPIYDDTLRIVTCSYLAPVKRVELLAKALKDLPFNIEWTHIGDGDLRADIDKIISKYPNHIKANIMGMIDSTKVQDILIRNPFNLFINISSSEGVPFSIMEALSSRIPVMATNVGGTGEIIDDSVGKILPKEITADTLKKELIIYQKLSKEEKERKAENAYNRYAESCDANALTQTFANLIKTL